MQQTQIEKKSPPVVAPRNDMAEAPVDQSAFGNELENQHPDFAYQWVSTDPKHPQYVGRYLHDRRVPTVDAEGKPSSAIQKRWQVVTQDSDPVLEQGLRRADQGVPIDNKIWNGSQVLIKTPKANAAISVDATTAEVHRKARAMRLPESTRVAGGTTVTSAVAGADADEDELRGLTQKKGQR